MAVVCGVLAAIGFAWSIVLMQLGLKGIRVSPFAALLLNLAGGSLVLAMAVPLLGGLPQNLDLTGVLFFVASGFSAALVGQAAMFAAIRRIGSTRTACFVMADNVFAVVLAFFALGQTISVLSGLGILVLMAGAVAFIMETTGNATRPLLAEPEEPHRAALGIAMAVLSALCFAGAGVLRGLGVAALPAAVLGAALNMIAPLVVMLVFFLLTGRIREPLRLPRSNTVFLLLSGAASAVGTTLFILALQYGGTVAVTTALKNTQPLWVFALALVLLHRHERLSLRLGVLVGLVVAGGVLTALGRG